MFSLSDTVDSTGWYLLEFDLGGEVRRYTDADAPVTVATAAGGSYVYQTGLLVDPISAVDGVASEASVGVEVADGTDWAAIEDSDVYLDDRDALLLRWFEGQLWDDARVILRGVTAGAEYETAQDPLTISVERALRSRSMTIPRPRMRVNDTTWPDTAAVGTYSHDERVRGSRYPILIGNPGQRVGVNSRPGAPALLVQESNDGADTEDKLLIAGHRCTGTSVRIFDYTDGKFNNSTTITIAHQADGLGRQCAYVALNGSGLTVAKGRAYYQGHGSAGGGLQNPRGGTLRGAGSVLRYMLETYTTARVDGPAMDAAADYLDSFKLDCAIYEPIKAADWVQSRLLPLLPVTLQEGPRGLFPQVWRWDYTRKDAIAVLDADKGQIRRMSRLRRVGDVRNEFTLHYRMDAAARQYRATVALSGNPGRLRDGRWKDQGDIDSLVQGSYLCKQSQARFGRNPADDMETDLVWDAATAGLIIKWKSQRDTFPRRIVEYEADSAWEWLPLGAVVRLSDSEVSLTDRVAIVADIVPGPRTALFTFLILDHPINHTRATT